MTDCTDGEEVEVRTQRAASPRDGREAVAEAASMADAAERALTLAQRLVPIIQDALKEGYAPKEIATVLRKLADAGDEAQEEEDERQ